MAIVINILLAIHVLVALLIILLVLMQRPKSEGLGAAFGGGMTDNLFGAQGTNVLQTITRWLGGIFFAAVYTILGIPIARIADKANRPWVMTNLKTGDGLDEVIKFIEKAGCLAAK